MPPRKPKRDENDGDESALYDLGWLKSEMGHARGGIDDIISQVETLTKKMNEIEVRLVITEQTVQGMVEGKKEFRAWAMGILAVIIAAIILFYFKIS